MLSRLSITFSVPLALVLLAATAQAQQESVKPGINNGFKDPNPQEWVTRFEGESREVFNKRMQVVASLEIEPGMTVADVGAGTGLYVSLLAAAVGQEGLVYANDISENFLDFIAERAAEQRLANVKTVLGQDDSTNLPEGSIDVVFTCDTYHHFEFPQKMLASIHRALKPGGRLVVVDFIREPGKSRPFILDHVRAGQATVEQEIADAGFTQVGEVTGLLEENYLIIFKK